MKKKGWLIVVIALMAGVVIIAQLKKSKSTGDNDPDFRPVSNNTPAIANRIIASYPHDTSSYTEGFEIYNGKLYESGGDYANSRLQFGDLKSGAIEKQNKMGTDKIFGEGLTILNGKVYQLTYTSNIVYVYDVKDITRIVKTLPWNFEGWGLTNNGKELIVSTGSSDISFVDPETFKVLRSINVHDDNGPISQINELEFARGAIWANIYTTKDIIRINPETGAVTGKMNFASLPGVDSVGRSEAMNGIAYDSAANSFYITGKRWSKIYEVKVD